MNSIKCYCGAGHFSGVGIGVNPVGGFFQGRSGALIREGGQPDLAALAAGAEAF